MHVGEIVPRSSAVLMPAEFFPEARALLEPLLEPDPKVPDPKELVIDPGQPQPEPDVTWLWIALGVGALLWGVKKLVVPALLIGGYAYSQRRKAT